MLVVADASPIHVLVRIELIELLPQLFGEVLVPSRVLAELHRAKPAAVQSFATSPPAWLAVRDPRVMHPVPGIDSGEEAAINLAEELAADLLLIDDLAGRRAATRRGLRIVGTLAILERAAYAGRVDLEEAFNRLRSTDFYVSESLLDLVLHRYRDSRGLA